MNGWTMRSRKKSKHTFKQIKMTTQQPPNLWEAVKAVIRGKFIILQAYLKKWEKAQINNLSSHLKELEKEQWTKPIVSRRKEIIKIRAEIKEIKSKMMIQMINESNCCFCDKINKVGKPLASLIKKKGERTQIKSEMKE